MWDLWDQIGFLTFPQVSTTKESVVWQLFWYPWVGKQFVPVLKGGILVVNDVLLVGLNLMLIYVMKRSGSHLKYTKGAKNGLWGLSFNLAFFGW